MRIGNVAYFGTTQQSVGVPTAEVPLDIPTPDDNPSVTHPSVVYVPGGFGGYAFWMAFTPYPAGDREDPCIVASHDRVNWEVPPGVTNPLVPTSEATELGYSNWSDTHLLFHDGELLLYFRGQRGSTGGEGIFLIRSSNGRNWSTKELVFDTGDTSSNAMSPSVIYDGNQFVMYTVNHNPANPQHSIEKRTSSSPTGFVYEGATPVLLPDTDDYEPWHVDVQYDGRYYHMLVATHYSNDDGRLLYFESDDGNTFVGKTDGSAVPPTGLGLRGRFYRSALVPVVGQPLSFDVYVSTYEAGPNTPWRIFLMSGVDLRSNYLRAAPYFGALRGLYTRRFIPAQMFEGVSGATPYENPTWYLYRGWNLPHSENSVVVANVDPIPEHWQGVDAYLMGIWNNPINDSDAQADFRVEWRRHVEGTSRNLSGAGQSQYMPVTVPEGTPAVSQKIHVGRTLGLFGGDWAWLKVERKGADANDNLQRNFLFFGLLLEAYEAPGTRVIT